MITIIKADGAAEQRQLNAMRERAAEKNADIELAVKEIMRTVKEEGFAAVKAFSKRLDGAAPYEI